MMGTRPPTNWDGTSEKRQLVGRTRPPTNLAPCVRQLPRVGSASGVREATPHAHSQVGGPGEHKQVDSSHPVSGARPPTNWGTNRGKWQLVGGQAIVEYIMVSIAIVGAALAIQGLVQNKAQGLMQDVRTQMTATSGLADSLF